MKRRYLIKKNPAATEGSIEWQELSGKEFYIFYHSPERKNRYFIRWEDLVIEVTREQYLKHYREVAHHDYLKKCEKNSEIVLLHYHELEQQDRNGETMIVDLFVDTEGEVFQRIDVAAAKDELQKLADDERWLLEQRYMQEDKQTLQAISDRCGIPVSTLQYREQKLLKQLRRKKYFSE